MKYNYEKLIKTFKKNGYVIVPKLINSNYHEKLFKMFYDLALTTLYRYNLKYKTIKKLNQVRYPNDIKILDDLLLFLLKKDKKLIGEIYDTISYSSIFLRFISDMNFEKISKKLLEINKQNTIYSWTHRIRIDPPRDSRRTYGWHQEIFYTIPNTKFLQTWCPIIRNAHVKNGTIELCPKSHKEGVALQSWSEIKNRATQIIVNKKIVKKFKQIKLPMKLGDVLFFNPFLFHRSGSNSTKNQIRFSLVGMWNDTTHDSFKPPIPSFKSRTFSSKIHFKNEMKKIRSFIK
ncbi:phytanoyl-CoA dioxygenase family protein [Candidatus Pelagibacter sp.]|jgi:hypothetical protein|nr:phytanoyl-CoA dioxygenase family protein [Candidatus Pelagibacter sp.]